MKKGILMIFLLTIAFASFSQDQTETRKKQFNLENGVALRGYDPVAYVKQNKAVKGKKDLGAVTYQGITYQFSSAENKAAFKSAPALYEPQYGGWCAYAMGSYASKVDVDPETFKIIDGKIYLFYNRLFNNTLKTWNKDEAKLKQQADVNWSKISH